MKRELWERSENKKCSTAMHKKKGLSPSGYRWQSSQNNRNTTNQTRHNHQKAIKLTNLNKHHRTRSSSNISIRRACCSSTGGSAPASPDRVAGTGRRSCRSGSGGACGVVANRVLGATGVFLHAVCLAGQVAVAVGLALGVVGGADEVWYRLGVFGGIGGFAVAADAGVVEGFLLGLLVRN